MHPLNPRQLPLKEGSLFIDNSFLETFQECPRLVEYSQLLRRQRKDTKPGINFGSAGHLVLDYRYSLFGPDLPDSTEDLHKLTSNQSRLLAAHFDKAPQPEGDWRDLNWAHEVFVHRYNRKYPVEPFSLIQDPQGNPMVETPFAILFAAVDPMSQNLIRVSDETLFNPGEELADWIKIFYSGRIDLPVLWDNALFVLDHKCVSILGESSMDTYRVSPQQIGYAWAFWKLSGTQPLGFVMNLIRTKSLPLKPKNGLDAWWEESFYRMKEYLQPRHFIEWEYNTFALMEEFFWHYFRQYFPLKRVWCSGKYGRCAFYDVCYSDPASRDLLLAQDTFVDNTWSPLNPPAVDVEATVGTPKEGALPVAPVAAVAAPLDPFDRPL